MSNLLKNSKVKLTLKIFYALVLVLLIIGDFIFIFILPKHGLGGHVAYSVYVSDCTAFVTGNYGTTIMDIENPNHPQKTSILKTSDGAFGVTIEDDTAYIASDSDGFIIANVSNLSNPEIIGEYNDGKSAYEVCIDDYIAYIVYYHGGLDVINFTNPNIPLKIGSYSDGGRFSSVAYKDDFLFVGDPDSGLKVFNVSLPFDPQILRTIPSIRGINGIYIADDLLFLSCHGAGVRILDISIPQTPLVIGSYSKLGGEAYGVTGNNTHLYVADLQLGSYLLDIANPSIITEIASFENAFPHDIFFNGKNIFLADQDRFLIILDQNLILLYSGINRDISLQILTTGIILVLILFLPMNSLIKKYFNKKP